MDQHIAVASHLAEMVDLERYPLSGGDSAGLTSVIKQAQTELAESGCARIPGFIQADAQPVLLAETDGMSALAAETAERFTPYTDAGSPEFPDDHPRNRISLRTNRFVTQDLMPTTALIQQLYRDPAFQAFIAACLSRPEIHPFADPMRGLVVNVMPAGTELPWHFDTNEFVVSLMTRRPANGGTFEYSPAIRTPDNERYEDVRAVLDGDHTAVRRLELDAGDLQIFCGRYALHRVVPAEEERHVVVFGYSENPGYIGSVKSTMASYGRVMQEHIDADATRHLDGLAG